MNILVTGANGQLGNEMRIVAKLMPYNFVFTDVVEAEGVDTAMLDITNLEAVQQMVAQHSIDCIVNCAAYTNVDAAESNQALAEQLNAEAPRNLALAMKQVDGLLIHISTDYVFGGDPYNTPCREDQTGTPTGVYGLTKLHGEQNIIATGCKHIIIRTAWLYSEFGKNFVKTMFNLTATKPQLKVVFDQVGTPTYALDLANAIAVIIRDYEVSSFKFQVSGTSHEPLETLNLKPETSKSGIYHFSNLGVCSWYDFTKMIAEYAGHTDCDIQPCHSDEFPSSVKRPAYSVLDKTKIQQTFHLTIPYWTDSLKACLAKLARHALVNQ